jgi:hypothetical protein
MLVIWCDTAMPSQASQGVTQSSWGLLMNLTLSWTRHLFSMLPWPLSAQLQTSFHRTSLRRFRFRVERWEQEISGGRVLGICQQSPSHTVHERVEAGELGSVIQLSRWRRTPLQHGVTYLNKLISIAPSPTQR